MFKISFANFKIHLISLVTRTTYLQLLLYSRLKYSINTTFIPRNFSQFTGCHLGHQKTYHTPVLGQWNSLGEILFFWVDRKKAKDLIQIGDFFFFFFFYYYLISLFVFGREEPEITFGRVLFELYWYKSYLFMPPFLHFFLPSLLPYHHIILTSHTWACFSQAVDSCPLISVFSCSPAVT